MTIKSIHLPLAATDERRNDEAVVYAADLAAAHGARLAVTLGVPKVFFAFPQVDGMPASVLESLNDSLRKTSHERAEQVRATVLAKGAEVSTEVLQASTTSLLSSFAKRSRTADLVIARAAAGHNDFTTELAEDLLLQSGRPVIFVPDGWSRSNALDRVVVAWDGGARAARAVGDAMPLLETARAVEIVVVVTDERDGAIANALHAHLARHVRQVTVTPVIESGSAGETLAAHARNTRADLLIAGAYGHSRVREFILGGTTKDLFGDPPCPLMMSF